MNSFRAIGLVVTSFALAGDAYACTIPVFRYALDRWEADKFELVLPIGSSERPELSDLLRPHRANSTANLSIVTSKDPTAANSELRTARLGGQAVWGGELNATSLDQILDSPARQKILSKILAGDSVIWVIAQSNSPEDLAEADRIEKRLRFLEQVAALPIQDPNDPDSQLGPGPDLQLKFTTLRLDRNNPSETLLLKMLAGPSGDFDHASTSFAAAVFGRGRVLGAWPLEQLDDAALEDASMFLIGRCSCRVKDQNPGWDILMNVDWEKALQQVTDNKDNATATPVPVAAEIQTPQPEPVTTKTDPTEAPEMETTVPDRKPLVIGAALVLTLVAFLLLRPKS
jgi:hypothetical protein